MQSDGGQWGKLPVDAIEVLSLLPRAVVVTSPEGLVEYWNSAAEGLYGWSAQEALGSNLRDMVVGPAEKGQAAEIRAQVERNGRWDGDFPVLRRDGTVMVVRVNNTPLLDDAGQVVAIVSISEDVTEQRMAERHAREAASAEVVSRQRLEFLKRITDLLADARDRKEVMAAVTKAAVPMLGDWCSISVLVAGTPIPEVETAHVDPAMVSYARELQARFPFDPDAPTGVPAVIRTGMFEFYPEITAEVIEAVDVPEEAREIVEQLALRSAITVPLIKRGRILGAMSFIGTDENRRFTTDDLILAQAVAGRIASTLENLRLLDQQRTIATTLQASLLPARLAEVPGMGVAVRYWAAGEGTEVGGDFYDTFKAEDGRWVMTIGDVCGNGPEAAALTGLTRHTLRDAVWHGDNPVEALASLNRAMIAAETGSFCTALVVFVEPCEGQVRLTVAIGGHPHPIVVHPDGSAGTIGETGTLVGVYDDAKFTSVTCTLHPGDLIVLYTDGITDVPPPNTVTTAELVELVSAAVTGCASAEDAADALGRAITDKLPHLDRGDDIALLIGKVQ